MGRGGGRRQGGGFEGGRMSDVLALVRYKSGWGRRKPAKGTGMGVAFYYSHLGYFAEVVHATVAAGGKITADKLWVAADLGSQIINPTGAENQVQGAALHDIGEALGQASQLQHCRAEQNHFDLFSFLPLHHPP